MEAYMDRIIIESDNLKDSIDYDLLKKHTKLVPFRDVLRFDIGKLEHLHILSSHQQMSDLLFLRNGMTGCYVNEEHTWLLMLGPTPEHVKQILEAASDRLQLLDVRFSDLHSMDIEHLSGLQVLRLRHNHSLGWVLGLERAEQLKCLSIRQCGYTRTLDVRRLTNLEELYISEAKGMDTVHGLRFLVRLRKLVMMGFTLGGTVELSGMSSLEVLELYGIFDEIRLDCDLPKLTRCFIRKSRISDAEFLTRMPELNMLMLTDSPVTKLPDLRGCPKLSYLNAADSGIAEIAGLPTGIKQLMLSGTDIRQLPPGIRDMRQLSVLNLNYLRLEKLPVWLHELKLPVTVHKELTEYGISLYDTRVDGVDMSVIPEQHDLLRQWLEMYGTADETPAKPINEIKVAFLGDGEAGKSLVVHRLLNGGEKPESGAFNGDSTPGIAIHHQTVELEDRTVRVNYWDFGGQEILHAMHRIFQTHRTVYVVVLNARNDTQDERARYWLRHITSFENRDLGGSRIMLVLNKTDQNPRASINMTQLRRDYPELPDVVLLSAREDSVEEFNNKMWGALKREIASMEDMRVSYPDSWYRVKERLERERQNRISAMQFDRICDEAGVDRELRPQLQDYLHNLGVSFRYKGGIAGRFVLLRPEWATNAIYKILFNRHIGARNGIISYNDVLNVMVNEAAEEEKLWCVSKEEAYHDGDADYILRVMRDCDLSYQMGDDEFIPMLCERDAKETALAYMDDEMTVEVWWQFDYLPDDLLFRLMVYAHLRTKGVRVDQDNVWLKGAVFRNDVTGQSALVLKDGDTLKIYARSTVPEQPAGTFMKIMEDALYDIITDSFKGLLRKDDRLWCEQIDRSNLDYAGIDRRIVLKERGLRESFDSRRLRLGCLNGASLCYSKVLNRSVRAEEILELGNFTGDYRQRMLVGDILDVCTKLQSNNLFWKTDLGKLEDYRNTYIRDMLICKHYQVCDQTFNGESASGIRMGELDLLINRDAATPWAIVEALNYGGWKTWKEHLEKLVIKYNPQGLRTLFLIAYTSSSRDLFPVQWSGYSQSVKSYDPGTYRYSPESYEELHLPVLTDQTFVKAAKCCYECGGEEVTVYHIFVRLGG